MASDEVKKLRKIKKEDIVNIFQGCVLFFDDGKEPFEVEVVKACAEDCKIKYKGNEATVTWDSLRVLT